MSAGDNLFLSISLGIVGLSLVAAGATFAYGQYLTHLATAKAAELATEEQSVNPDDVQSFVRLRDRLATSKTLLNSHIVLSQFFTELERVTLQSVSFTTLVVTVTSDNSAQITMAGTAKSFNALAAQSNAFAADSLVKRAIISGITINKDGTVGFTLTADLDPRLVLTPQAGFPGTAPVPSQLVPAIVPGQAPASSTTRTIPGTPKP